MVIVVVFGGKVNLCEGGGGKWGVNEFFGEIYLCFGKKRFFSQGFFFFSFFVLLI